MPEIPVIDLGAPVSDAVDWLTENLGSLFDLITDVMLFLLNAVLYVLTAPHAYVVTLVAVALPVLVRKYGLALFALVAFVVIQAMDLWIQAMQTLAVVVVAAVIAVIIGVPVGIWASRSREVSGVARPLLDLMQTLPVFVYLIPAVFFFGVGVVPGVVATTVFAIPPAVRLTELGIRGVDTEVVEAAHAFGAKPRQILREVQIPLAMPSIMAGVNQTIMLALSMVVIAGMVGADGLGSVVVRGISTLDVGAGFEGGLGVVLLAIYLDRLSHALSRPRRRRAPGRPASAPAQTAAAKPAAENTSADEAALAAS
ncbi:ABC transporter permease [Kineosporia succinea]|uniref:Glycine betaine/proline transport system permease protein n=1 Tax=Kineosporia succinea TaxID=84632 RepID=A0ABT9PCY3_9ACTN|nr:ABC transporter permease subunit [Kineosporia succinea]MDP9830572.1 glycine betaine/proline transport system permease protein [Kineosporia succinea]